MKMLQTIKPTSMSSLQMMLFTAMESTFLVDDSAAGEHVPKIPKVDDETQQKRLSQVTSTDLSLYEHEDDPVGFAFNK